MSKRDRHVHQIKMLSTTFSNEFDRAMGRVVRRRGLDFFTDDQIAEFRAEMIRDWWFAHRLNRENRKRRAA